MEKQATRTPATQFEQPNRALFLKIISVRTIAVAESIIANCSLNLENGGIGSIVKIFMYQLSP